MSKNTLDEGEKKYAHLTNQEEYNDEDFAENYDMESEKNKIVEKSPKGRFIRFNEELGSGAYKTVYKAYDNETGWEVAWNVIKLQRLPDKERKRISDEIALLKQLKHPNIIHFISAWINRQKDEVIFITEAVTGGSLKRFLKRIKTARLKVIKTWCREILNGIEYLHNLEPHPIIHRDIKCDNIFINSNKGEIRIGDLGLATFMSHAYADSVLGTPEFMAPEMYEEVYGPSVDIYSFGMCVLEIVTNQTPYRECANAAQIYKKVIKGEKPAALELIANEEVKNFIMECLKPKDERPTATELLQHHFLTTADPELDNQPVELYETPPPLSRIEEENSIKGSLRTNDKVQKLYQQALLFEEYNSEKAHDADSSQEEEKKETDLVRSHSTKSTELKRNDSRRTTASEKMIQANKPMYNGQSGSSNQQGGHGPKIDTKSMISQSNKQEINGLEEPKREEAIQLPQEIEKKDHSDDQYTSDGRTPKQGEKRYQQESQKTSPGFDKQTISRGLEKQRKQKDSIKGAQDEGGKSAEWKKQQLEDQIPHPLLNKETSKYFFTSRGIMNNYLVLSIKNEQENNMEQIVEVHKDKISAEKIKRKLLKHLDVLNPHDPYFLYQLNLLFETLASQNIQLTSNANAYYNPIVQMQMRSFTNDSQRSPDRSIVVPNPNSVYFQPKNFNRFYNKYMKQIPKEYLMLESEEAMNLRHQREIIELENIHLVQKRNLWDRRQNIMTSSTNTGTAPNGLHFSTFDADDFYHKFFQANDISSRSGIKKKGSRGTDYTISSVDSGTISPTFSSGNVHSISNWPDINLPIPKKDEASMNTIEEGAKISIHNMEMVNDIDKSTSNTNPDPTPIEQLNLQQQNSTGANNPTSVISPKGNANPVLSAKYGSNVAMHTLKPATVVKAQSDKSGYKDKKQEEKDVDALTRPSIEKNLEGANLVQLIQGQKESQTQSQSQVSTPNFSQVLLQSSGTTISTPHTPYQSEGDRTNKEGATEGKKEAKFEKLTINTNISSPPQEKTSNLIQPAPDMTQQKAQQKPAPINQGQTTLNVKKPPQLPLNNSCSSVTGATTPTNHPPIQDACNSCRATSSSVYSFPSPQPNSATLKHNALNQPTPSLVIPNNINKATNAQPTQPQSQSSNPIAQKLSLAQQNSVGAIPVKTNQPAPTSSLTKSFKLSPGGQTATEPQTKSVTETNMSHATFMKLQSPEFLDKIKNYRMKGIIKRNEPAMNHEDVKMLQICLELLTESDILPNGNFSHYTENLVKICQTSIGLTPDGVVDQTVWEKMISTLDQKIEKKRQLKEAAKQKDINDPSKGKDDPKQKIKDKQNKESSECLNKIESNLLNLSDLK